VESAREGIWEVDALGRTLVVNDRMASMQGYSSDEMSRLILPDVLETTDAEKNPLMKSKVFTDTSRDFIFIRKDGSQLSAIITQAPVFNDNGEAAGMLYMVTDITARKQLENDLLKRDRRLKEKNRLLEEKNSALRALIEQVKSERERLEQNVMENVDLLLTPILQ
jgi:PAS domain S-box-containing protein